MFMFMLSTLDKLCRNLNEEKYYETRKYLQNEFGGTPIFQFMFAFHLENYMKIYLFIYFFIYLSIYLFIQIIHTCVCHVFYTIVLYHIVYLEIYHMIWFNN